MKIVIPSYKRTKIDTLNLLEEFNKKDIFIFVNNNEEREKYCEANPGYNVITTNKKGITPTRNYILDFFGDGEEIVMLDDDVKRFRVMKIIGTKKPLLDIVNIKEFFEQSFKFTKQLKYKLWGVQMCEIGMYMTRKINTDKFIIGTAMGIINSDLRFDEEMQLKEDYDFTLKHIIKFGGVLRWNFITVEAKHYSNLGGCVEYRKKSMEENACKILLEKYPTKVMRNIKRPGEIIIR